MSGKRDSSLDEVLNDVEDLDNEFELPSDALTNPVSTPLRIDPASVAARVMLNRCIRKQSLRKRISAAGAVVVIGVPDPEWVPHIASMWKSLYCSGAETVDGAHGIQNRRRTLAVHFQRTGTDNLDKAAKGNDTVAEALWSGMSVYGFAPNPRLHLPSNLLRAADFQITVPPLDVSMLRTVIRDMTGRTPSKIIPEGVPPKVTPTVLQLARRIQQTANDYANRIIALATKAPDVGRPGPLLEDLHGMDVATNWGKRVVRDSHDYRAGRIAWKDMDVGALLFGKPGTGKTLLVEALARSSGLPLIATSFSVWQSAGEGYLGNCLKAMRASFTEARLAAPCILFIDEMDALGSRAGQDRQHRDYWTAVVTCFLEQMDGIGGREGVLVVGATNDPTVLDEAILRSGRMDRLIEIPLPDQDALEKILRHHLGGDLAEDDISGAARLAVGGTGADCARWVRSARQRARHEDRPMTALDLVSEIGGPEKPQEDDWRIAVHEAGHAVVSTLLMPGLLISAAIGGGTDADGACSVNSKVRVTHEAIHAHLLALLAGRAAEQVILGNISGGSGGSARSDLALATCMAAAVETALGLGDSGLLWLGAPNPENVGTMFAYRPALAAKVTAHLDAVYAEVVELVTRHRTAVSAVAQSLLANRLITGAEVTTLVEQHPPEPQPAERLQ